MTANGNVFTRYFQQFNWSAILDDVFSKIRLLGLFVFTILGG